MTDTGSEFPPRHCPNVSDMFVQAMRMTSAPQTGLASDYTLAQAPRDAWRQRRGTQSGLCQGSEFVVRPPVPERVGRRAGGGIAIRKSVGSACLVVDDKP